MAILHGLFVLNELRNACNMQGVKGILPAILVLLFLYTSGSRAQYICTTNADNTLTITGYSGTGGAVTIPTNINNLLVTTIGDDAFASVTNITSVTILDSVTGIGTGAFLDCVNLTSASIPNTVTNIGSAAFSHCYVLTNFTIPASVTSIGEAVFAECYDLTKLTVDARNPVYSTTNGILFDKSQTTLVEYPAGIAAGYTIPYGVVSIGNGAFAFTLVTNVTMPGTVTNIGDHAFYFSHLTSVTIPGSVNNIGDSAFAGCFNLANIYFMGNAPNIGSSVFQFDTATIYYFSGATGWSTNFGGLTPVEIPYSVSVNADNSLTITGYTEAGGDLTIPTNLANMLVTSIGDSAFYFANGAILTSVTIPGSITSIGNNAFEYCPGLTNVTIPASVTNIGDQAFAECLGLITIAVDAQNPFYSSENGVLFDNSQTTLIQFPGGLGGSYTIPGTVTSIGDFAFSSSHLLTNISIPSTVTNMGRNAFGGCGGLTNVTIPGSVTSIGDFAFLGCANLKNVTIANGVISIGNGAFAQCMSLNDATIPNSVTSIGYDAFQYCYSLDTITIPGSVANIGYGAFASCISLSNAFFTGNAPAANSFVFGVDPVTIYYLPNTTGWGFFYGLPTVLWDPLIQTDGGSFGVQNNQFGFNITGTSNIPIVVEVCTNLASPAWTALTNVTLTNGLFYFCEPLQTNSPSRYYRISSP